MVVADVFAGARTPAHLTSVEYAAEVARVLRPDGWYLANIADGPPLRHARAQVATVRSVLPRACLVGDAAVLRGRRYGNLVLVAGRVEPPVPELTRRAAGDWFPGRVLAGDGAGPVRRRRRRGPRRRRHRLHPTAARNFFRPPLIRSGGPLRTTGRPCPWGAG